MTTTPPPTDEEGRHIIYVVRYDGKPFTSQVDSPDSPADARPFPEDLDGAVAWLAERHPTADPDECIREWVLTDTDVDRMRADFDAWYAKKFREIVQQFPDA